MVRAIVFDLDYTLAVPSRDRETILAETVDRTGAPSISRQAYLEAHRRHLTRESREPIFEELLAEQSATVDAAELAATYRESIADSIEPLPGVESMLADLRAEYRLGLLTNGPVRAQRDKLEILGWVGAFDAALVTGELKAGKPDPRAFEAILAELDADAATTVYVGDEPEADIGGATGAGLRAVQVMKPDGPGPDDRAVASVDQQTIARDLPPVLEKLRKNG